MRRFALAGVGLAALVAACSAVLPERYAVNVPIRSLLGGSAPPSPETPSAGSASKSTGT